MLGLPEFRGRPYYLVGLTLLVRRRSYLQSVVAGAVRGLPTGDIALDQHATYGSLPEWPCLAMFKISTYLC